MSNRSHQPYDLVGDIHGELGALERLLETLGYRKEGGSFAHPEGRNRLLQNLRNAYCLAMSAAYLIGESREQELLLPARVEDYVDENSPARVIDVFVDGLSAGDEEEALPPLREMGGDGGRRGYHPADLARLLIWGYVNRVRSTRQLETAAKRNLEVMWLLRGLTPDHSSISRFRKANRKRIKRWLKEFNLVCASLGLIGGEEVSIDGVFLKAVNSKRNNYTRKKLERQMERLDKSIGKYLRALEKSEAGEEGQGPGDGESLAEKLERLRQAKEEAAAMLEELEKSPTGQVSTVDPDSRLLTKSTSEGSVVGFLAHGAVDGKAHLMVAAEISEKGSDRGALSGVLEKACEVLPEKAEQEEEAGETQQTEAVDAVDAVDAADAAVGEGPRPRHVLGDGGFFDIDDLRKCEQMGWTPWVPPQKTPGGHGEEGKGDGRRGHAKGYRREDFAYDPGKDLYRCPAGQELKRRGDHRTKAGAVYRTYYDTAACRKCPVRETCCKSKAGYRKIFRHEHEETAERIRERQAKEPLRYRRRAATVEHPFGSMMFWNEGRALLCRGKELAGAEFSLSALAYNMKRAVAEVGVQRLVEALRARMGRFSGLLAAFRAPGALPSRPGMPAGKFSAEFA